MFFKFGKRIILLSFLTILCLIPSFAQVQWRPVTPAEMQLKTPQVEPDADAEAIFWEIRLDDKKRTKLSYEHYVRVKIFTERGRERFSKFDIPFIKGRKIEDVAARVIKADGTIIELQPGDIFEREIVSTRKIKIKAKSFAVPGIEPGAIVEYQYKETVKNDSIVGEQLSFQRDIPMQKVLYSLRPYNDAPLNISFRNMEPIKFSKQSDGFHTGSLTNVPAFTEEPQMPPEDETKMWAVINSPFNNFNWLFFGSSFGNNFYASIKENRSIKAKAQQLTANAATQDEKLKAIFDFCRNQIKNASYDPSITDEQREKLNNKKASDVLEKGIGDSFDIDILFAALASAAGFDVDLALSGDRSENFFNPDKNVSLSYIHPAGISVKFGDELKYFSPGKPYKTYGKLDWFEENVYAMITNSGGFIWKKTPLSAPADSLAKRIGNFTLSADGTLEGTVSIEYNGLQATARRRNAYANSVSKREEDFKEELKADISTAEISAFSIENFEQTEKPLIYKFKVRVQNYAQKTGKRIFFQPNFFEYGASPLFSAAERKYGIYFPYPWSVEDSVEWKLPGEYEFENIESPPDVFDSGNISRQVINISINREKVELSYSRKFHFGEKGNLLFPAKVYTPLKGLFDKFHEASTKQLTLKQKPEGGKQ